MEKREFPESSLEKKSINLKDAAKKQEAPAKKKEKRKKEKKAKKPFYWKKKMTRRDYREELIVSIFSLVIFVALMAGAGYFAYTKIIGILG